MPITISHVIKSKSDFIGTLNHKAWDALIPYTPFVFSDPHVELIVADVVKSVASPHHREKVITGSDGALQEYGQAGKRIPRRLLGAR